MVGKLLSSHLNAIAREREDNGWAEKKLQPPKLFWAKVLFKLDSKDGMQIHTDHTNAQYKYTYNANGVW